MLRLSPGLGLFLCGFRSAIISYLPAAERVLVLHI